MADVNCWVLTTSSIFSVRLNNRVNPVIQETCEDTSCASIHVHVLPINQLYDSETFGSWTGKFADQIGG